MSTRSEMTKKHPISPLALSTFRASFTIQCCLALAVPFALSKEGFVPPALIRGASTGKTENPNHPTPLSIEKLKYYAESQDNMPVRLSLAKFISTELPIRFAVTSLFTPS